MEMSTTALDEPVKDDPVEAVSRLMQEALQNTDMSQRRIAEDAKVSTRTIYQLKEGKRDSVDGIIDSIARIAVVLDTNSRGGSEIVKPVEWLRAAGLEDADEKNLKNIVEEARGQVATRKKQSIEAGGEDVISPLKGFERLLNMPADNPRLGCALYTSAPEAASNSDLKEKLVDLIRKGEGFTLAMCVPYFTRKQIETSSNEHIIKFYESPKDKLTSIGDQILIEAKSLKSDILRDITEDGNGDVKIFIPNSKLVGMQSYPSPPNHTKPFYTTTLDKRKFINDKFLSERHLAEELDTYYIDRKSRKRMWHSDRRNNSPDINNWRRYFWDIIFSWANKVSNEETDNRWRMPDMSIWEMY